MMDLTPLDVRKKMGDFRKALRGYEPEQVDGFLQIVAERMETLVRENLSLREREEGFKAQVKALEGREKAVQEALVVAQQLREEVKTQARREVEILRQEADAERVHQAAEVERQRSEAAARVAELEARRAGLLRALRVFLQGELAALDGEEARPVPGAAEGETSPVELAGVPPVSGA
jgi:cell division initiation protein